MTTVWLWLRADARHRWRSWMALTLLLGLFGGAALLTASGARRTQTAERRFMVASNAGQVQISPVGQSGMHGLYDDIRHLRGVADLGVVAGEPLLKVDPSGRVDTTFPAPVATADGRFLYRVYKPNIRAGRLPDPDRPDEAFAALSAVRRDHLHVGSRLTLQDVSALIGATGAEPAVVPPGTGRPVTFTIVGVGALPDDVVASAGRTQGESATGDVYLTPAYYRTHGGADGSVYDGAELVVRPGTDLARLRAAADEAASHHTELSLFGGRVERGGVDFTSQSQRLAIVDRAVRPQAAALALFGVVVGLGGALVVGQAIARQVRRASEEAGTLRSLGMDRSLLVVGLVAPALFVAALGSALAVAVAVAASPLMPIGPARLAEPHPGVALNAAALGPGFVVIVALVAVRVLAAAWRLARHPSALAADDAGASSRLVESATRAALPPTAVAGVGLARSRAAPVAGGVVAVAAVIAALTFSTNMNNVVSTPRRYGWGWHLAVDGGFNPLPAESARSILGADRGVAAYAGGDYGGVTLAGRAVPTVGLDQLHGTVFPTLLAGRPPRAPDEIVLGTETLRRLTRSVGDTVELRSATGAQQAHIVGRAVFPDFERGGFVPTDLGDGAAVTATALYPAGSPLGEADNPSAGPPGGAYNFYLVRFAPGVRVVDVRARLERAFAAAGCAPPVCTFFAVRPPADVSNYAGVRWTPAMLAGLLALLAAVTLGHALVSSVRGRRRELAVLKTVGFVRRQVSATVAWQATAVAAVTLVVGLPIGVAAGRWLWTLFANQIGVAADPRTPLVAVLVAVPVTVAVANTAAAAPAWAAGRVQPARVLKAE